MKDTITTDRLLIEGLAPGDAAFILELVNTPGWLKFIGDRNVKTIADGLVYIQKMLDNPAVNYWVVKLSGAAGVAIGVISFIKKDYLEHEDIGFAFLPGYAGKGYAYEAADAVLSALTENPAYKTILATVAKENSSSIKLLEKLGLKYTRDIQVEDRDLMLYSITALVKKPQS